MYTNVFVVHFEYKINRRIPPLVSGVLQYRKPKIPGWDSDSDSSVLLLLFCPSHLKKRNHKMSALSPRNRIVVFRLSQDEFETLKCACAEKGGRNLSEFTRSELLSFLHAQPPEYLIHSKLDAIARQLVSMRTEMQEMSLLRDGGMPAEAPPVSSSLEDRKLNFDVRSKRCV